MGHILLVAQKYILRWDHRNLLYMGHDRHRFRYIFDIGHYQFLRIDRLYKYYLRKCLKLDIIDYIHFDIKEYE